ncbi:hypothetical protein QAD02_009595, partial [Eretmocerus hayati]
MEIFIFLVIHGLRMGIFAEETTRHPRVGTPSTFLPPFAVLADKRFGCRRRQLLPPVPGTSSIVSPSTSIEVPLRQEGNQERPDVHSPESASEHSQLLRPSSSHEPLSHELLDERNKQRSPEEHSIPRSFSCEFCNRKYQRRGDLNKHKKSHSSDRPHSCQLCNKKFKRRNDLQKHVLSHNKEYHFTCSVCGKKFKRKYTLKEHMKSHSNENSLTCAICRKKIGYGFNLKAHMMTHSDYHPFNCALCNKGFKRKSGLKAHVRCHTAIRPYPCQSCHKRYKTRNNLSYHVRTKHTNKKSFACEECGKSYESKVGIQQHSKSHSQEKLEKKSVPSTACSENLGYEAYVVEDGRSHEQTVDAQEPGTIVEGTGQFERRIPLGISNHFSMDIVQDPGTDDSLFGRSYHEGIDQSEQPTEVSNDRELESSIDQIQNNPGLFGSWVRTALEIVDGGYCPLTLFIPENDDKNENSPPRNEID